MDFCSRNENKDFREDWPMKEKFEKGGEKLVLQKGKLIFTV